MQSRTAVGATNAAIEENLLTIHWIITNLRNNIEIAGGIENKKWDNRMIPASEAISTLDIVKYIIKKTRNISSREIIIFIDNKANLNSIHKKISK